jgi:hypothetical protein
MRIVPQVVFGTMVVGVVPAVALSCGDESGCKGPGCTQVNQGVAAVAYQCFDANDPNCHQQGVAAVAFQCFDGSTAPQCQQLGVADAAFEDVGDVEVG